MIHGGPQPEAAMWLAWIALLACGTPEPTAPDAHGPHAEGHEHGHEKQAAH